MITSAPLRRDDEADHAREPRRAVVLAREPDRDADREEQAQVGEDRVARRGDRTRCSSRSGWPRRSSSPAIGSTAIGSISARPSGCVASISFIVKPPVNWRTACAAACSSARSRERRARGSCRACGRCSSTAGSPRAPRRARGCPGRRGSAPPPDRTRARRTPRLPCRAAWRRGRGRRDQAQHRRMQRVELAGQLRMRAIHRERVLRKVVGADRQEIGLGGELVGEHRRGGRLDHHAERSGVAPLALLEQRRARRARPARRSPSAAGCGTCRLHAQDRAQLRAQQIRPPEARAHAAQPERRIVLARHRQIGDRLVAADVERADRQRAALRARRRCAWYSRACSSSLGRLAPLEEQELGAQQAAAFGAELDGGARLPQARRGWRTPRCATSSSVRAGSRAAARSRARRAAALVDRGQRSRRARRARDRPRGARARRRARPRCRRRCAAPPRRPRPASGCRARRR